MQLNYFEIKRLIESLSLDDIDIIKRRRTGPCFESTLPDKFKHLSLKQIKEYILSNILGKFYERDQGCIVIDTIYLKDLIEYLKSKILGDIYLSALEYILNINFEKNLKGDIYAYSKGKDLHILFNLDGTNHNCSCKIVHDELKGILNEFKNHNKEYPVAKINETKYVYDANHNLTKIEINADLIEKPKMIIIKNTISDMMCKNIVELFDKSIENAVNDCRQQYIFEDVKSKDILINAETENEAIEIIRYFFNNNVSLNEFTLEENGWYMYGSKSCYGVNNGYITLKNKDFINKKYTVISINEIKKGVI